MRLFGFNIVRDELTRKQELESFTPKVDNDGAITVVAGGAYGSYIDLDGAIRTEAELVTKYRDVASHPEVEAAIEEIVNDSINADGDKIVTLNLDQAIEIPPQIKQVIAQEFDQVMRMLDFHHQAQDIFERWYIDGRLYYHAIVDASNVKSGIQELRYIDPRKIRKVKEVNKRPLQTNAVNGNNAETLETVNEYYVFNEKGFQQTADKSASVSVLSNLSTNGIKITEDAIVHITSGVLDSSGRTVLSHLHKAIKPLNQLRTLEDASVIYRLCLLGNTRVRTNNGFKYIKDIRKDDVVYTYTIDGVVPTRVTNQWSTGIKKVYSLSSVQHKIECTEEHPILVHDNSINEIKYKTVKEINTETDSFVLAQPENKNELTPIPSFEGVKTSDFMSENLARLFGFILAKGKCPYFGITFTGEMNDKNMYYYRLMDLFFGNTVCYKKNNETHMSSFCIGARDLFRYLGMNHGKSIKQTIPTWVFNSPEEIKRAFVQGVCDAGGSYTVNELKDAWNAIIQHKHEHFLEAIKELWQSIGLSSTHITRIKLPNKRKYEFQLQLFNKKAPKFDRIVLIEEYKEEQEVYDIEVEHEKHNFIANGVVVHNSRAPERRVWYIDVGNLPKMKAEQYMNEIMIKQKNRLVYDAQDGNVRDDRKFMCYSLDTKIPLLDGRTLELQEIIKEYEQGKLNWVYSCDPTTGKFYPGPVSWAGITKRNAQVVRITFDNSKSVVCTPDHKFPVWNKGFVEAQHLTTEDSIIPGYRRKAKIGNNTTVEYEQIYKNETGTWEFTHREVSDWKKTVGLEINDDLQTATVQLEETNLSKGISIIDVEFLEDRIDVGSMAIDNNETYHSHHTYLLDAGVYTKNTLIEDFWIARREGNRGTQVETLPAGQNLGQIEDIIYFQKRLYRSLNVPIDRLDSESGFNLGRASEITRSEQKFSKFCNKLRKQFSNLFLQVLEKQLILKNIITPEEWEYISYNINFDFSKDNYFEELKNSEILNERMNSLNNITPYVGKYYSHTWVRRNVLKQDDQKISEIDQMIMQEMQSPQYNDVLRMQEMGLDPNRNPLEK